MKFRELLCKYIAMRVVSMIDFNKLIYDLIPGCVFIEDF